MKITITQNNKKQSTVKIIANNISMIFPFAGYAPAGVV
jgi:hypothetical protein